MIEHNEPSREDIAHRAYELYVRRGGGPGKAVEDWVRAEKELTVEVVVAPTKTIAALAGRNLNQTRLLVSGLKNLCVAIL
jgi:hypothetical protein